MEKQNTITTTVFAISNITNVVLGLDKPETYIMKDKGGLMTFDTYQDTDDHIKKLPPGWYEVRKITHIQEF